MSGRFLTLMANVATVFLVAALTHFVAILILPDVASKDAYDMLAPRGAADHMTLLPPSRPGDTLVPYRDPTTVQGFCFFDLAKNPQRIRTNVEEGRLLTLSFRTPAGKIFYSMTDRAALHGQIDIRLVNEAQLQTVEDGDDDDAVLPSELRLRAPTRTGLIVATAMVARPGERKDAEARIKAIICKPEPLAPPEG